MLGLNQKEGSQPSRYMLLQENKRKATEEEEEAANSWAVMKAACLGLRRISKPGAHSGPGVCWALGVLVCCASEPWIHQRRGGKH